MPEYLRLRKVIQHIFAYQNNTFFKRKFRHKLIILKRTMRWQVFRKRSPAISCRCDFGDGFCKFVCVIVELLILRVKDSLNLTNEARLSRASVQSVHPSESRFQPIPCLQASNVSLTREHGSGPCWLLKLRQMGTYGVQMKRVLPWLVRWARRAGTRDFYPMAWLLYSQPSTKYCFPHLHTFYCMCPHRPCLVSCRVACLFICVSGAIFADFQLK